MEGGFESGAVHAARLFDVALAVHLVFLGNHVNDFFARHHGQLVHVFGEALEVELVNHLFGVYASDVVAVLQASNVLPGDAHHHSVDVKTAIDFGGFDGLLDRFDGLRNVHDDAALHAHARSGTVSEDFELAVFVEAADEYGDFGGADVKTYGNAVRVHGWLGVEFRV